MPGQYDGLFVEYSHVCQKEENKKSTKKHCFALLPTSKNTSFWKQKEKTPVLLPEDLGRL
jgi:hypothetical protein